VKERPANLGLLLLAVIFAACGNQATRSSRPAPAAERTEQRPAPAVKSGSSRAAQVTIGALRPCPPPAPSTRQPVGGEWRARVSGVGCGAVGRLIFDRFLGSGLQTQLVTTQEQKVSLGRMECGIDPEHGGWRVRCLRGQQRFAFLLRP
jgi:hypothetical protein